MAARRRTQDRPAAPGRNSNRAPRAVSDALQAAAEEVGEIHRLGTKTRDPELYEIYNRTAAAGNAAADLVGLARRCFKLPRPKQGTTTPQPLPALSDTGQPALFVEAVSRLREHLRDLDRLLIRRLWLTANRPLEVLPVPQLIQYYSHAQSCNAAIAAGEKKMPHPVTGRRRSNATARPDTEVDARDWMEQGLLGIWEILKDGCPPFFLDCTSSTPRLLAEMRELIEDSRRLELSSPLPEGEWAKKIIGRLYEREASDETEPVRMTTEQITGALESSLQSHLNDRLSTLRCGGWLANDYRTGGPAGYYLTAKGREAARAIRRHDDDQ